MGEAGDSGVDRSDDGVGDVMMDDPENIIPLLAFSHQSLCSSQSGDGSHNLWFTKTLCAPRHVVPEGNLISANAGCRDRCWMKVVSISVALGMVLLD